MKPVQYGSFHDEAFPGDLSITQKISGLGSLPSPTVRGSADASRHSRDLILSNRLGAAWKFYPKNLASAGRISLGYGGRLSIFA